MIDAGFFVGSQTLQEFNLVILCNKLAGLFSLRSRAFEPTFRSCPAVKNTAEPDMKMNEINEEI